MFSLTLNIIIYYINYYYKKEVGYLVIYLPKKQLAYSRVSDSKYTMVREDKDLDSFLKNVEDIDQRRQNGQGRKTTTAKKPPIVGKKPFHLSTSDKEESLRVAKGILDGSYKETDSYKAIIDGPDDQDSTLEVDYISEYSVNLSPSNPSSPKKPNNQKDETITNQNKKFLISEEEYALLQQLKDQKNNESTNKKEKVKEDFTIPSRGKPRHLRDDPNEIKESHRDRRGYEHPHRSKEHTHRNHDHSHRSHDYSRRIHDYTHRTHKSNESSHRYRSMRNELEADDNVEVEAPPSLPRRRYKLSQDGSKVEDEERPPPLPIKPQRKIINNRSDIKNVSGEVESNQIRDHAQKRDDVEERRRDRIENINSQDSYIPVIDRSSKPKYDAKPVVNRETKPFSSSKNTSKESVEKVEFDKTEKTKAIANKPKPPPPSSRSMAQPKSYMESLETNKLTKASSSTSDKSLISTSKASSLDYLDSAQNRGPPVPEKKKISASYKVPSDKEKSNGFIGSALKSNKTPTDEIKRLKPEVPPKCNGIISTKSDKSSNPENDLNNNAETKDKPDLPPKKKALDTSLDGLKKLQQQKPDVPNKSPDIAFPKVKLKAISKQAPDVPKKKQPFADLKLKPVQKPKPVIPPKKLDIELPELKATKQEKIQIEENVEINKVSLKKTSVNIVKTNNDNNNQIPEALLKHKSLAKAKTAPLVPQRKISMPEALAKSKTIREASSKDKIVGGEIGKKRPPLTPPVRKELTPAEKLEAILQTPNPYVKNPVSRSSTNSDISTNSFTLLDKRKQTAYYLTNPKVVIAAQHH
ncbi:hypothetical protein TPHA_0I03180 [Tetrapisispora phaffii CBS 4417]|uniref:Uncharacterized protein n=1 Tax=Tetrapisispora phaffii (strain ATCC 24235 / CBS 4417 / NBRC 1672 / NRRL Y-8282 / UCD 70-5) TaxID=1071381 RepID=G8BY41_TETPH|nr:hypothetical protein TPHA_0I03180 [Tetrapisispora phaffii CBS 4417]CCE64819.1 hypothetical protein TPHA_0I03180 [Tetrapisispora phaffii CBS 4417]